MGLRVLVLFAISCISSAIYALPAFPGAEGFGADTPGGRGGRVIKVTNLNPAGPGSLNAACQTRGPRIVVFEVSGVIRGNIVISEPHITIAGQTAPGAGITIGGLLRSDLKDWHKRVTTRPHGHDVVVRFLRVRSPAGRIGIPGFNFIGNYYKSGPSTMSFHRTDPYIYPWCFEGKTPYYTAIEEYVNTLAAQYFPIPPGETHRAVDQQSR